MEIQFEQLVTLLEKVTIIVAFYLMYKSVPSDKVSELLKSAKEYAAKTESELDDTAVSVAERVFEFFKKREEQAVDTEAATVLDLKKSSES